MSEQEPFHAYWDQQAVSTAKTGSLQSPQQHQSSKQIVSQLGQNNNNTKMDFHAADRHRYPSASYYNSLNGTTASTTSQANNQQSSNDYIQGNRNPTSISSANVHHQMNSGSGGSASGQNQQALLQLQQNLMLMIQQQKEQGGDMNGYENSTDSNQQNLSSSKNDYSAMGHLFQDDDDPDHDSNDDLLAQYRQLFGAPMENAYNYTSFADDGGLRSNTPNSTTNSSHGGGQGRSDSNNYSNTDSPSERNRLFALGGQVQPLSSSAGNKSDEISASSLGMSESSGDFMMKLFQYENPKDYSNNMTALHVASSSSSQNYNDDHHNHSRSTPISSTNQNYYQNQQQQPSHVSSSGPDLSNIGSATAALQQLQGHPHQDLFQQRQQQMNYSSQQQQHLQQQLEQRQQQLQQLQQQMKPSDTLSTQLINSAAEQSNQTIEMEEVDFRLPSTMLPPSVLASMFSVDTHQSSKPKAAPVKAGKSHIKARKRRFNTHQVKGSDEKNSDDESDMKPQVVFCEILGRNGYDKDHRFKADDSEYDAVPSPLQLASFGTHLVKAVQTSNVPLLDELLDCGLSPNPCNQFRDSVFFDLVIKRANLPIFECLVKHGCDLQVVDGFGRAPLHHCCWASTFCRPIAESILERDPIQIFLEDKHGQTPLEYVRPDLYAEWNDFLEEVADKYWPVGGQVPRILSPKKSRPDGHLVDPPNALSVTLAAMVSSGNITPEQLANMDEETRRSYEN